MATANGVGGDGGAWARGAERERGGDEDEEVGERVRGDALRRMEASRGRRRQPGREEVAGVWPRAPGTRPCLLA